MTSFKRARSEEQRAERRRVILDTAAAMLAEMPVAQVSLNELSRRVGLAKSNVLNYFESREAVLLELLDIASRDWLERLEIALAEGIDPEAGPSERGDQLAAAITTSLVAHPMLCDLISAQAAVLEHNVSPEIAVKYKRSTAGNLGVLARLVLRYLGELGEQDASRFAAVVVLVTGAVWTHAHPAAAILAAYEIDPSLAAMKLDLPTLLRELLEVQIAGLLARQ
jgi:AcrR family transcriptional regulator